MSDFRVANRYAKSLFDLAIELKKLDGIYNDMVLVEKVCQENRSLVTMLMNPIVRYDIKLRVLEQVFGKQVNKATMAFFSLICRKNRAQILPACSEVFITLYHENMGIIRSTVTSAVTLSEATKKDFQSIISKATKKQVELEAKTDTSLIGGYILRIGDLQVDDSIKTKLNELRRELKGRP